MGLGLGWVEKKGATRMGMTFIPICVHMLILTLILILDVYRVCLLSM